MGALTWRNVDAPDFTPSMHGYETFSRLLDSAFGAAQGGLRTYDNELDKSANNRILMQFAGIQDPEAAKAALAQLSASPEAARLSAATIGQVEGRPNTLIAQALNQDNLDTNLYTHARVKGFNAAEDAAAPLVADRLAAYAAGKGPQWEASHPDAFRGLSMAAQTSLYTQAQQARQGELTNQGADIQNQQGRLNVKTGEWKFGNDVVDRNEARAAAGVIANYYATGHDGSDLDGVLAASGLSGPAQLLARQLAGQAGGGSGGGGGGGPGGNGFAGSGSGNGGGGAGGSSALAGLPSDLSSVPFAAVKNAIGGTESDSVGGYGALAYDTGSGNAAGVKPPKPITDMTMGELYDFQRGAMRAQTRGYRGAGDIGSTGAGRYQFESQTLAQNAQRAFGNNWRNVQFSPENQDKVAETLWNTVRGDPAALSNTWAVFRNRPSPAQLAIGQTLATQGTRNQFMQGNASSIAEPIQAALTDTSSPIDVATGLVGDKGPLKGANRDWVMNQIRKIQTAASNGPKGIQLSPAAAAVILQRSVQPTGRFSVDDLNSDAIGGGLQVDQKAIKSYTDQVASGDFQRQVVSNQSQQFRAQQIDTAKALHDQALARLQVAQQRAATNPSFDRSILARLMVTEATTAQALQAAVGQQGDAASAAGAFGQTAAPPPPPPPPRPPVVARGRPAGVDTAPGWFGRANGAQPPTVNGRPVPAWTPTKGTPAPNMLKYYLNPTPSILTFGR